MRIRPLLYLAMGHMVSDLYPGMLSPLLPLILARYGMSMALAGLLVTVLQVFCNLTQPFFGILNDNRPMRWFLWAGLLVSAVPFSMILKLHSIHTMALALAVTGIGVGMFHPIAAVAAGLVARERRRGISMAIFSSGGTIGFMIAPILVVYIIERLGESSLPLVVVPAVLMTGLFLSVGDITVSEQHKMTASEWFAALSENKRELFLLWLVSSFRAVVHTLVNSFLPLLAIARGASYVTSAYVLSGSLFASMIGMFLGGHLSDIHGRRKMMAITLFLATPLLYAFLYTTGIVSMILLMLGMGALSSTIPVNIVLAQSAAPKHSGMASSLVMGMSFALGAITATPFGALADSIGIAGAMNAIFIIPLLGGLIVLMLRKE